MSPLKTKLFADLALVVQKVDLCPLDSAIGFPNINPLHNDLSGGQRYPTFEQPGPACIKATVS